MEQIRIETEYITLGQLLKEVGAIDTGGMAKWYLSEHTVIVNAETENRRGKKLRDGDVIDLEDGRTFMIAVKD
ncbi:S4 domain-containing protein YaaA [Bacillus sp. JCM 19041]|uniref:S4 domain-containing protein YaaA n=1 Tax=Bacillus sp. JCM 19041 TaxID=1460637 RepID=UPI0009E701D9